MDTDPKPDVEPRRPVSWAKRLSCPCGADRDQLALMNYEYGWYRIECHAGEGCDNFGPSGFRKHAVGLWNEMVVRQCKARTAALRQGADLAILVRRLIYRHSKALPLDELMGGAADYLTREGLNGSPLRELADEPAPKAGGA